MRYLSFDLQSAKLAPQQIFNHPRDVLCVVNLTNDERLEILQNWREQTIEGGIASKEAQTLLSAIDAAMDDVEAPAGDAAPAAYGYEPMSEIV